MSGLFDYGLSALVHFRLFLHKEIVLVGRLYSYSLGGDFIGDLATDSRVGLY